MSLHALGRLSVALFALSTAFPLVAGLLPPDGKPRWLGVADVVVAALTFVAAVLVAARGRAIAVERHRAQAYRVTMALLTAIPVLLVAFLTLGAHVDWTVLVVGLAWRAWLFVYTLPFLLAVLEHDR